MDETGATIKSTIVVYIVATTANRLTAFSFAKAMEERLIQPASVLDSTKAIARLFGQRDGFGMERWPSG
jgi:hypothetical protein